jgi:hypothetical protein
MSSHCSGSSFLSQMYGVNNSFVDDKTSYITYSLG